MTLAEAVLLKLLVKRRAAFLKRVSPIRIFPWSSIRDNLRNLLQRTQIQNDNI